MRNREQEIILGAVVFLAAVIVVVGTVWLSERYAGAAGGYRLRVSFDSVPGLQVGNPVTFRGVWVGKVLGIALENGHPIVTLGFAEVDGLPRDSEVLIKSDGLLGGQMIEIRMGISQERLPDGALIEGISGSGLEKAIVDGGALVTRVNTAMDRIASDENLTHLSKTIARVDTTTRILNALWKNNQENLNMLLDSLALASGDASGMLKENRADLRQSVVNMRRSSERLAAISGELEAASAAMRHTFENLQDISHRIRKGEGTVGRLIQSDSVYLHLSRTLTSVDSLVNDIKRDPTRYFRFSVF